MSSNPPDADGPAIQLDVARCSWTAAPPDVALRSNEVHIWCAAPGSFAQRASRFRSLLSTTERERAARFHFPVDSSNYIVRHGLRRLILSQYLRQDPSQIEIVSGYHGKPTLASGAGALHFNDSHSADLALFAITAIGPIGVDIEHVKPIPEFEEIASQYFCLREVEMMRALPPEQRMKAFYSCWTSKEAYLKATGEGIGESLNKVEVTLDSDLHARSIRFPECPSALPWNLLSFSPAPGYLGAAVLNGSVSDLRQWQVPADPLGCLQI